MSISSTTSYCVRVASRHPHIASHIRAMLSTSNHDESTLSEEDYDLYECSDEVEIISVSKHDQLQTQLEYESDGSPVAHVNFLKALRAFPQTSVLILNESPV